MPVLVRRQAPASPHLPKDRVRRIAEKMMDALGVATSELSVLLTDDLGIARLNHRHRGKKQPTDVLAFPLLDPEDDTQTLEEAALGDVVISLDTAQQQADRDGRDLIEEVRALLAHGLLHLLGYDHKTARQEREMNEVANRLIEASSTRARVTKDRSLGG